MDEELIGLGPKDTKRIESLGFSVQEPIGFRDQMPFIVDGSTSTGNHEVDRSMHGNRGFVVRFGSPDPNRVSVEIVPTNADSECEVFDVRERIFVPLGPSNSILFGHRGGKENKNGEIGLSRIASETVAGQRKIYVVGAHFTEKGEKWEVSELRAVRLGEKN